MIMIQIKIESEIITDTRKFKSDARSVTFLKRIARLHHLERVRRAGRKPLKSNYKHWEKRYFREDLKAWERKLKELAIPCKVIIEHI